MNEVMPEDFCVVVVSMKYLFPHENTSTEEWKACTQEISRKAAFMWRMHSEIVIHNPDYSNELKNSAFSLVQRMLSHKGRSQKMS